MKDYEVFLQQEAFTALDAMDARRRYQAVAFMDRLASNPFFDVDLTHEDEKGRLVHRTLFGDFMFSFSVDHAMGQVLVFEITLLSE